MWHGSLHSHCRLLRSSVPPCDSGTMWSHSPSSVTRPQAWQVYWSRRLTASTSRRHGLPPRPLPQRLTGLRSVISGSGRPLLSEESTLPQEEYDNADGCCLDANVVLVRTWLPMLGQDDDPAKSHQHDHCPLRPAHHKCSISDSDWPSNEGSSSGWLTYR